MERAVKTGFVIRDKYSDHVEYEYRGRKYEVEYAKGFTYCCTNPAVQHKIAQEKIDEEIEREARQAEKEVRYEDTAEYGFDLFWEYVNQ